MPDCARSDREYDDHDASEDFVVHVCDYFWDCVDQVEYRSRAENAAAS